MKNIVVNRSANTIANVKNRSAKVTHPTTNEPVNPKFILASRLQKATETLHTFTREAKKRQAQSGLKKTVSMMKVFLDRALGREKKQQHNEILEAIETINSQRIAIGSLDNEISLSITKAIDAYNTSRESSTEHAKDLPKIAIPRKLHPIVLHYPAQRVYKVTTPTLKPNHTEAAHTSLSKQASELFHMKVISLLEKYGIATNPEARQAVRNSPIAITINAGNHICTLTQTIQLFPWQTITIHGDSTVDPITQTICHLLPDSFSLSLVTLQTAFPHPMQRAGWTLSDELLPNSPQRLDLLPQMSFLYDTKMQLQEALLSDIATVQTAKNLFKKKRQAFKEHADEFLDLHHRLASWVCASAAQQASHKNLDKACEAFFLAAKQEKDPYNFLGETHDFIRDTWITRPYHFVVDTVAREGADILTEKGSEEVHRLFNVAYEKAKEHVAEKIKTAPDEKSAVQWAWIRQYGTLIGAAAEKIMLQYLSEDLGMQPPELTLFEAKLQASAYRHLVDFIGEIERGEMSVAEMASLMRQQILTDIDTFEDDTRPPIASDLAVYFNKRYAQRIMDSQLALG